MRLRIPCRLRIRGRVWRVELVPDRPRARGGECWGLCEHATRTISIWAGLSRREREITYAHELLHAMTGMLPGVDPAIEEHVIRQLAVPMRALLAGTH